jgi:hypothetical protein
MAARKTSKRKISSPPRKTSKARAVKRPVKKRAAPRAAPKKSAVKKKASVVKKVAPARKAVKAVKVVKPKAPGFTIPELPEIEGYVRSLPPPIVPIVNRLRAIVRAAAPEARELLDPNGPAYDANGLFARIEASDREVMVTFLRGAQLDAPGGALSGEGTARALAVRSIEDVRESVLRALVRQAVLLNAGDQPPASGAV